MRLQEDYSRRTTGVLQEDYRQTTSRLQEYYKRTTGRLQEYYKWTTGRLQKSRMGVGEKRKKIMLVIKPAHDVTIF